MSDKEAAFAAELLEKIVDTDAWISELMNNSDIHEAEEKMSEALKALGSDTEDRVYAMTSAAYAYADEVTKAAVLYGIRVADALRGGQLLPAAVNAGT